MHWHPDSKAYVYKHIRILKQHTHGSVADPVFLKPQGRHPHTQGGVTELH